jgi:ribosomal protein L7Ae-like RNA K-turn-binding protein
VYKIIYQVMKSIARNVAEVVILAADTEPIEIVLQVLTHTHSERERE